MQAKVAKKGFKYILIHTSWQKGIGDLDALNGYCRIKADIFNLH